MPSDDEGDYKNTDFHPSPGDAAQVAEAAVIEKPGKLQMRCRWTKTVTSGVMKLEAFF